MRKKTDFEKSIKVTLYRIACASPKQSRTGIHDFDKGIDRQSRWLTTDWGSPEASLVWHIYERAVFDYFGMGTAKHGFGKNPSFRNETAESGFIALSGGKRVNILELLGISPDWAWTQLQTAVNYTKMKEAA